MAFRITEMDIIESKMDLRQSAGWEGEIMPYVDATPLTAEKLFALSADIRALAESLAPPPPPAPGVSATFIRSVIRARRLRGNYFNDDLFADPAWDMMLDLLAARMEGRQVSVSSLCVASAVPPTTALRWITLLCAKAILVRASDPADARRTLITLSDDAAGRLSAYLEVAQSGTAVLS